MNNSAKGNMYEVTLSETWELFAEHLRGYHAGLVCIVSNTSLEDPASTALENSLAALGYGRGAGTFTTLHPEGGLGEDGKLDAQALFLLIEGLDPLCLIATDSTAVALLGQAYHQDLPLDAPCRVFGRTTVAFRSFSMMLDDPKNKQVAWGLLKKLPKLSGQS